MFEHFSFSHYLSDIRGQSSIISQFLTIHVQPPASGEWTSVGSTDMLRDSGVPASLATQDLRCDRRRRPDRFVRSRGSVYGRLSYVVLPVTEPELDFLCQMIPDRCAGALRVFLRRPTSAVRKNGETDT